MPFLLESLDSLPHNIAALFLLRPLHAHRLSFVLDPLLIAHHVLRMCRRAARVDVLLLFTHTHSLPVSPSRSMDFR
jgi:hypothetical protein